MQEGKLLYMFNAKKQTAQFNFESHLKEVIF